MKTYICIKEDEIDTIAGSLTYPLGYDWDKHLIDSSGDAKFKINHRYIVHFKLDHPFFKNDKDFLVYLNGESRKSIYKEYSTLDFNEHFISLEDYRQKILKQILL